MRIIAFALLLVAASAAATDLRGRVDGRNSVSPHPYPVGGTALQLYRVEPGGTRRSGTAFTGPDGMYYFRDVAPGRYVLQVQGRNYELLVRDQGLQDLPPLTLKR